MFSADGILGRQFSVMSAGLDGLAMRQQVHTENIANVDTKGYIARTVNFEGVLKGALNKGDATGIQSSARFSATGGGASDANMSVGAMTSSFGISRRVGNEGVDKVEEVSMMMNDNVRFRVLSQQVTNRLSELRNVIAEMGRG